MIDLVVTMTAYNRPGYLSESLASWAKADGIKDVRFLINVEPGNPGVLKVANAAPFPHEVVVNRKRLGVLANPHRALARAFAMGAEFAVLAEDDVQISNDVLTYMRWAAKRYEKNSNVLLTGAFSPWGCSTETDIDPMKGICSTAAVHRGNLTSPTPWGIWRKDWPELRDSWDLTYAHGGFDHRIQALRGTRDVIRPCSSRSQHIGREGGIHCKPEMFDDLLSHTFRPTYPPRDFYEGDRRFAPVGPAGSVNAG